MCHSSRRTSEEVRATLLRVISVRRLGEGIGEGETVERKTKDDEDKRLSSPLYFISAVIPDSEGPVSFFRRPLAIGRSGKD